MTLTHRICLAAALLLTLLSLGGCGAQAGGQTGEETDDGCVFATSPLSLQERSLLGFSAGQVLALAEGEQLATFDWRQTPGFAYGPESGTGQVTLRTSAAGPAKFARVDAQKSLPHCEDQVRIPVSVVLATAGGALAESFTVDLVATAVDEAAITELLPSAELKGAFAFDPGTLGGRRFGRLEINLRFHADGSAGYLLAGIESGDQAGGSASFQALPLACWGDIPSISPACGD
ncbi:MAG: hypothetical protein WDO69_14680 [Pseudomonadota bacterium]